MPDATITSTASTFGTISGVFSADQSTISGTISGIVPGTLTGSVGVPGPAGPGVPAGGTSGQFLQKTSGVDYATDWVTVNLTGLATESWVTAGFYPLTGNPSGFLTAASLSGYATESWVTGQGYITSAALSPYLLSSTAATTYYPLTGNPSGFLTSSSLTPYLTKADNLGSLTNFATARDNLGLGSLSSPTFAGITAQGSGANVANLTPTSLSLNHATSGSFTIQPSVGITFPDASVQTTAFTTSQLTAYLAKASNLSDLASTSTARTNLGLGSLAVVNDAPSDGSQYARKNGAWDVVTTTPDYITSVSSPLSVTSGNLTIDLSAYAPLASPAFTGNPTAPTATFGDNDTSLATTAFVQSALAGGTAVARDLEVEVRNQSGSTIAAGSIVYISGATGNKPLITLAQANNDANSAQTIGFVKTAIANNGTGYVIVRGELENIDTSALTEGVQLYLSPTTAGTWTTTKPSAPQHLVYVGIVIRSHPTLGTILVAVQNGYELDELHDVAIGTLANNDLLAYESSTNLWKNKTYSALGLLTSADAATTYQTLSGMSDYLTTSAASSTYYPLTNPDNYLTSYNASFLFYPLSSNPAGYLTSAPVTSVAGRTGAITLANTDISGLGTMATATASDYSTTTVANGLYYPLTGNPSSFLVAADIAGKADLASPALTGNVTITTNSTSPALVIVQDGTGDVVQFKDVTSDTSYSFINANGKVSTIASTTGGAGFNVPHGTAPTSPVNGDVWTTTAGLFYRINASTKTTATLQDSQNFTGLNINLGTNTGTGTIGLATGATLSGSTKTVNIGTAGVAGSTTNIAIGSTTGTSTTTLQGITNGVTQTAGDSSLKLATTAFVTTADNLKANIASPTFTGVPAAPTATAGTNTTQIATTAFVTAAISASTGATWGSITGTLSSQTDLQSALDAKLSTATAASTYAPLASPALTGNPTAPTPSTADNDTSIATTAFVKAQGYLTSAPVTSVAGRTGAVTLSTSDISGLGTMATATAADYSTTSVANGLYYPLSTNPAGYLTTAPVTSVAGRTGAVTLAVADVSGAAPTASPALSGTPTAPTATAGTNTTQIATTAFVTAAIPTNNVKAWVNFNGGGTPSIRASLNVSSITDNGVGDYTVNMTTALADANFTMVGNCSIDSGITGFAFVSSFGKSTSPYYEAPTTTTARFTTPYAANVNLRIDPVYCNVAIIR